MADVCLVQEQSIDGGPVSDDDYGFSVTYTARFDPAEIGTQFHEFVRLRESDSGAPFGGGDDDLTSPQEQVFTATSAVMHRRRDIVIPKDVADTEVGHEEIYAEIWLRSQQNLNPAVGPDCQAATGAGDFNP